MKVDVSRRENRGICCWEEDLVRMSQLKEGRLEYLKGHVAENLESGRGDCCVDSDGIVRVIKNGHVAGLGWTVIGPFILVNIHPFGV